MQDRDSFHRRLVEASRDGIWALDLTGQTIYHNARAAELLGRTAAEMAEVSIFDVLDDVGKAQFHRHLEDVLRGRTNTDDVECCYLRGDGSRVRLVVSEHLIRGDDGEITCVVHRLADDEARRALLTALSRSNEQLAEAQAIAGVGSWEIDLLTGRISWSLQLYDMLGADPERFRPSPEGFFDLVVPAHHDVVTGAIERCLAGDDDATFDFQVRRPDGQLRWMRGRGRTTSLEDGTPSRIGGTVQDISDLKKAELQLLDAVVLNMMMQALASAANEAQTIDEALRVSREQLLSHDDWSRGVAFGVTLDEQGVRLEPIALDHDRPDLTPTDLERDVAERALLTRRTVFEEETLPDTPLMGFLVTHDGDPEVVVVATACSPFVRHKMLRSAAEQTADQLSRVIERQRSAEQLAAARDAAMEASRLKSEFLTTMSHEIRTPMNGVIGLNDLLLRTSLAADQLRLAQGVQVAGRALIAVINDILDFSKIEAGGLELESVEFEVRPLFEHVRSILLEAARAKEIELIVDVAPEVPAWLVGDPHRLSQVVSNLASNAVKFTEAGHVRISVQLVAADDGVVLRTEVIDTGIGITGDLGRLFEPFRQADASTTRTFGGTGLGLAISHQLVAALGGEIGVTSEPGVGSAFWFTGRFSAASEHRPRRVHDAAPATSTGMKALGHVLVAEDNDVNQLVALGWLDALGFTADVAGNGEEAVAKATTTAYDVVLMDLQMPGTDGFTATRAIRAAEAGGRRVPIIAMTASAVDGERDKCLEAGMDDFLTKPVDGEKLETVLRAYAGGPAGAEPLPALLDLGRLTELDAMGERAVALVDRAVQNFVTGFPGTLESVRGAVRAADAGEVRHLTHKLRGSALTLGAMRVAAVSQELEELADLGTVDGAQLLVDRLAAAGAEACDALVARRFGQAAAS
ncbi:MAG TPA: ATP-binding protein [Marmoricola sp.]|nr:ATP-binding protein [Marmoricola sp.]